MQAIWNWIKARIFGSKKTTVAGIVGAVLTITSFFGLDIDKETMTTIIAGIIAAIGLFSND